jgi:CubicO group peptidase (beta-lactamase class C family)
MQEEDTMRESSFLGVCLQILVVVATLAARGPALEAATEGAGRVTPQSPRLELEGGLAEVVARHGVNTAGFALIKNGQVVWQHQYGQQSSGVPASADTLFDVASLTKTVTAETILRLVADAKLSLDEPMSDYWVDPDLRHDPRHRRLTARMALSHTTGFMNWRFFAPDGKLAFINEPGERFGYSGEGFEYVAKYAENKLGVGLEELAKKYVFEPIGMTDVALSVRKENFPRIARPLDADGTFHGYYCRPEGWCRSEGDRFAAGSMVITVADYAKFLISSMQGEGLSAELEKERDTIHGVEEDIDCSATPHARCPTRVGYGLGWSVTELGDDKLIGHRGSDWSAVSLAYYYKRSGDGLVIFFNAPNKAGIAAMVDALELLDPDSSEIHGYKTRRARASE